MTPLSLQRASATLERLAFVARAATGIGFAFDTETPLARVGPLSITTVTALLMAAIGLWFLARLPQVIQSRSKPAFSRRPSRTAVAAALWVIFLLASTLLAPSHRIEAARLFLRLLGGLLAAWAVYDLARTPSGWELIAKMLALGGFAVALLGLGEAANWEPVIAWLRDFKYNPLYFGQVHRISSTLNHPNTAAMALELTLPLLLAWTLTTPRCWLCALLVAGLIASLAALALTLSRGGIVASLIVFALTAALAVRAQARPWAYSAIAIVSGAAVAGGLILLLNPFLLVRVISEGSDELWYRAVYQVPERLMAQPGETLSVTVRLTNSGLSTWQAAGSQPYHLSYHVLSAADEHIVAYGGLRTSLPTDVPPQATLAVTAQIMSPSELGDYQIAWDMIQEGVTWFSRKGQPPALTSLNVSGAPIASAPLPTSDMLEENAAVSQSRFALWQAALRTALDYPLLGVGLRNFHLYFPQAAGLDQEVFHAHSIYFEWLADTGFLGLFAFLWFSWELARVAVETTRRVVSTVRLWWLAVSASLLVWYLHGVVDFFYTTSTYVAFCLLVGLLLSLRRAVAESAREGFTLVRMANRAPEIS